MNRSRNQTERLLDLDRRLRNQEYPNCSSFAQAWEVSTKTVQRDIDFLRDRMGAPIFYDAEQRGFCYTEPTYMLPAIQMNEGELVALLMGSRLLEQYQGTPIAEDLMTVFDKLAVLLPESISISSEDLFTRFSFTAPPAMPIAPQVWKKVVEALTTGCRLRISYKGSASYRIHPVHLANLQGDWYLFAQFEGHDDFRQLALSRIQSIKLLKSKIAISGSFDPEKELATAFARFAGNNPPFSVTVVFDKVVAEDVLSRKWHPHQKAREFKDGRVEIRFEAKGDVEVQRWIMAFGKHAKVKSPAWLKERILADAKAILESA